MGHSSSRLHSSSRNDGQGSITTPTDIQPTSGSENLSALDGAKDNGQSQANMRAAAELDEILVRVNLKGQMVLEPYVISCEMLQRFEERYGEGDCRHLAMLQRFEERYGEGDRRHLAMLRHRQDIDAFVDYMMKIADCKDRPKAHGGYQDCKYGFASYWIGWDAHKNERFRKLGPCIGDHAVLHGATHEWLLTQADFEFMRGTDVSPKVDDKMIIDRHFVSDHRVNYPYTTPRPHVEYWNAHICTLLEPSDDDEKIFYSLQTLARLREAVDDPAQSSPLQISIKCSGGKECPASALWISMSREERVKHTEEMRSWLEAEEAKEKERQRIRNRSYGQASDSRGDSGILSYGREHSDRMLSHRKLNA